MCVCTTCFAFYGMHETYAAELIGNVNADETVEAMDRDKAEKDGRWGQCGQNGGKW